MNRISKVAPPRYNKESTKMTLWQRMTLKSAPEDLFNLSDSEPPHKEVPVFAHTFFTAPDNSKRFNFSEKKGRKKHPNDNKILIPESTNYITKLNPECESLFSLLNFTVLLPLSNRGFTIF